MLFFEKKTVSNSVYYYYLHFIEPKLAENLCWSKLNETKLQEIKKVAFDASWRYRRNANNCSGVLIDLNTNAIISFHIVHHGKEENKTLTSTDKHTKCMEAISLFKIIENTDINNIDHLIFVHDCDIFLKLKLNSILIIMKRKTRILYLIFELRNHSE